jgi:hypothetical protein
MQQLQQNQSFTRPSIRAAKIHAQIQPVHRRDKTCFCAGIIVHLHATRHQPAKGVDREGSKSRCTPRRASSPVTKPCQRSRKESVLTYTPPPAESWRPQKAGRRRRKRNMNEAQVNRAHPIPTSEQASANQYCSGAPRWEAAPAARSGWAAAFLGPMLGASAARYTAIWINPCVPAGWCQTARLSPAPP